MVKVILLKQKLAEELFKQEEVLDKILLSLLMNPKMHNKVTFGGLSTMEDCSFIMNTSLSTPTERQFKDLSGL